MKKKATNNIILDDKEMEVLIRQLVKEAGNKGFEMTKLNQAVTTIWKEEFVVEKKKLEPLTEEEEIFSKKVKKFLDHYGKDLIELNGVTIGKDYFLKNIYEILCSIYAVFQREERISQDKIVRFLKQHFDYKENSVSIEIRALYIFFYSHLYFSDNTELPVYSEKFVGREPSSLDKNKEFCDFCSQFDFPSNNVNRAAIATVWFIEKYF